MRYSSARRFLRLPLARPLATIATTPTTSLPISRLESHVTLPYPRLQDVLKLVRRRFDHPLTLSEKILFAHLYLPTEQELHLSQSVFDLRPDRVACHDATATMAMLQFISAGLPEVAVPTSIHCDHLIVARDGAVEDLANAENAHREVYDFLSSASQKYNIGFWKPGSGIIHPIIFENYAFPGGLIIGTDSHTPNAGGMAMLGVGVGGSDVMDAMTGMPWELQCPQVLGIHLTGQLSGWTSSKDLILNLAGQLSVSGGKGKILEFFGPGTATLSATAMATVCNMSAEVGATSCIFPYTDAMARYLQATDRQYIADAARQNGNLLTADSGSESRYGNVITIDLTSLEPHINGPFTPDLSHKLSKFAADLQSSSWPTEISHAMIGSCTNSSYEDLKKASGVFKQANEAGLKPKMPVFVTAGSEKIRATVEKEGLLEPFENAGAVLLSNSCGPCVGQWARKGVESGRPNSVVSSYNRNFDGRHDGNTATHSFVTSPELVSAFAFAGDLSFNPSKDFIADKAGKQFHFDLPSGDELPVRFQDGSASYQTPVKQNSTADVVAISPTSDRLQLLQPFQPWKLGNADNMRVLVKVGGKCTTDHISPAGPWYKYRGHLENISNNLLIAATNAFLPEPSMRGLALDIDDGGAPRPVPQVARSYLNKRLKWCIIGDWNYGEGSSREHAALEPRYLGGVAVIARSFARIHETNLKKQGMLALTFTDAHAYDRIGAFDKISIKGVECLHPGRRLTLTVGDKSGKVWETMLDHTYHEGQIPWLMHGSALNYMKAQSSQ